MKEYKRTRVYVSTFKESDDPPWVEVSSCLSFEALSKVEDRAGEILDRTFKEVRQVEKWKEAKRHMRNSARQVEALAKLGKAKKPNEASIKTAKATLENLTTELEEDFELWEAVRAITAIETRSARATQLVRAAGYVMASGGDFGACGVEMVGEPLEWMRKLLPRDMGAILVAATSAAKLDKDEVQDLPTPPTSDSAMRKPAAEVLKSSDGVPAIG